MCYQGQGDDLGAIIHRCIVYTVYLTPNPYNLIAHHYISIKEQRSNEGLHCRDKEKVVKHSLQKKALSKVYIYYVPIYYVYIYIYIYIYIQINSKLMILYT